MFGGGGGGTWNMSPEQYQDYLVQQEIRRQQEMMAEEEEFKRIDGIKDPEERLKEKRKLYRCGKNFHVLSEIPKFEVTAKKILTEGPHDVSSGGGMFGFGGNKKFNYSVFDKQYRYDVDEEINAKIGLIKTDVTKIEVGAVTNAANDGLRGGGGVDGAVHSAAGPLMCNELEMKYPRGGETGRTYISKGYKLPAEYVLHTIGPVGQGDRLLRSSYRTTLDLCLKHKIRTVALCCISIGIFDFPAVRATHIAADEARKFLQSLKEGTYISYEDEQKELQKAAKKVEAEKKKEDEAETKKEEKKEEEEKKEDEAETKKEEKKEEEKKEEEGEAKKEEEKKEEDSAETKKEEKKEEEKKEEEKKEEKEEEKKPVAENSSAAATSAACGGGGEGGSEKPKYTLADIDRIIFAPFLDWEVTLYHNIVPSYFPIRVDEKTTFPAEKYDKSQNPDHDDYNRDDARKFRF